MFIFFVSIGISIFSQAETVVPPRSEEVGTFQQDTAGCTDYRQGCMTIAQTAWRGSDRLPIVARLKRHTPRLIMIHHSGMAQHAKNSPMKKIRGLYDYSVRDKKWGDAPYHYYIDMFGNVISGRAVQYAPDTNTGQDTSGIINIVVEGDYATYHFETDDGKNHLHTADAFSAHQQEVLTKLIRELRIKYGISSVVPHAGYPGADDTLCPGDIANVIPKMIVDSTPGLAQPE